MHPLLTHWLFAELTEPEQERLSLAAIQRAAADGQMLFHRADPTPGLHLVEEGAIRIFTVAPGGEERIIDIVGPGEFCGEMGVVDAAPSAAWGQAIGPTRYWVIPAPAFERLMLSVPSIGLKVSRVLVAKLRTASQQLDEALFLRSRDRVLRQLVRLAERHGRAEGPGTPASPGAPAGVRVELRLTHQEIARLVGTARETVSRVLAELQDLGLLTFVERQMRFTDLERLRTLAGLD